MSSVYIATLVVAIKLVGCSDALRWNLSTTSTTLLSETYGAFIGINNASIFILGGDHAPFISTTLVEYNRITQRYWNHTNVLPFGSGVAQSYIQIESILYFLPDEKSLITGFDLKALTVEQTINYPGTADMGRCVTSFEDYLVVIGGKDKQWNVYNNTYIFNMIDGIWFNGTSLPNSRVYHSCNTVKSSIYVIGGYQFNTVLVMNVVDTNNCCHGDWIPLNDVIHSSSGQHRSVVYQEMIYVLGADGDRVQLINTKTRRIERKYPNMIYAKYMTSVAIMEDIVYVFGGFGYDYDDVVDGPYLYNNQYFQYSILPTTDEPSKEPTASTNAPTNIPTNMPSMNTYSPTKIPTTSTRVPTNVPTNSPTIIPTISPTIQCNDIHFVCYYNGDSNKYITLYLYSEMMVNASLSSIEAVTHSSAKYDNQKINEDTKWKRAGITFFGICKVFGTDLDDECPEYNNNESEHIAVGQFGIAANEEIDQYKKQLLDDMNGDKFTNEFNEYMKSALAKLDATETFEAVEIKAFDASDYVENIESDKNGILHSTLLLFPMCVLLCC